MNADKNPHTLGAFEVGVPLLGLLSLLADIVCTSNQLFILSLELDFGIPSNHSGNMQGKDLGGKPG